ncbi:MAG: aminotransferase class I/II-fold pyridoxal phosphate-dependent enzyme [Eubacteriales bacterium]|nr:aminotransferase class I/II-fold pyridoxal phosphate-dependent enzyme [Eubacteriales bacterium]
MRNPLSDVIQEIKPSGIRKFFDVVNEMPDAITLGVGEPDFETPGFIREAGIKSLNQGHTFYTSNLGMKELREEICQYAKEKQGLVYDPLSQVLVTVGGSEAIDIACRALLNPGEEAIIPEPCYVSYLPCVKLAGGVPVSIPLQEKNEFRLTPDELRGAISEKTKLLFLAFPNNPTGAIMSREDLEALREIIIEHDLIVISDEIYSALSYHGGGHVSIAELPGMQERTIVINGFSKAYAMTGWRLGYAMGPELIIKQMTKIHQFAIMCAPTTSQYAAIQALRFGDSDVQRMCASYNQRRKFLLQAFHRMGLPCFEPFGAFYVFPNVSQFGMTSEEFATRFLQTEKVAVVPGTAFGDCGEGFIRISYAYSIETLQEAMQRLERFIAGLRG